MSMVPVLVRVSVKSVETREMNDSDKTSEQHCCLIVGETDGL